MLSNVLETRCDSTPGGLSTTDSEEERNADTSRDSPEGISSPCLCCNKENLDSVDHSDKDADSSLSERRQRRKPLHPKKSPSPWDPDFKGVTLYFHTIVHGSSSELIITPYYSNTVPKVPRRRSRRSTKECAEDLASHEEGNTSGDEHPAHGKFQHAPGSKCCASCGTRRTPLWRDAEDGTPLCNACGIRYRKYRLRCSQCWHIPRKDNKLFPACSQCGGVLRYAQNRKQ